MKVLGIQPAGSTADVPLVQGSYLLMGGQTLTPKAVMDAVVLTEIRHAGGCGGGHPRARWWTCLRGCGRFW